MEPLVGPVQHFLTPDARTYRLVDVIGHFEDGDALREAGAGVFGCLQEPRNERRLERPEKMRFRVQVGNLILVGPQSRLELTLPFGVLDFQGMKRSEQ